MTHEAKKSFLTNCLFFAVIAALIYCVFKFMFVYIFPFAIGLVVSMVVQKPAFTLHKRTKIPKGVCMMSLVIVLYIMIMLLVTALVYGVYSWLSSLTQALPGVISTVSEAADLINARISSFIANLPIDIQVTLNSLPSTAITTAGSGLAGWLTDTAAGLIAGIPSVILGVVITVIASAFIANDYTRVVTFLGDQLPPRVWDIVLASKHIVFKNVFRMLRGYALLMLITFAELTVTLLIIGYGKDAFALAALIAVIDILPVLGTGAVLIPWGIVSLIFGNFFEGIVILVAYLAITVLRNTLEPKIIGQQVGIHPLLMLFVLFVGLRLFGILGMFGLVLLVIIAAELQRTGKIHIWVTHEEANLRRSIYESSHKKDN